MANSIINLLNWENRLDLEYIDSQIRSCTVGNNSPLNKVIIKLHKGVDNQVRFRILNPDRKRVSVDHLAIRARLVDAHNKERVLERFADLVPNSKGDARLTIYEGDLINIAPGFYNLVVTGQEALIPNQPAPYTTYRDNTSYTAGQVVRNGSTYYSARNSFYSTTFSTTDWTRLNGLPQIDTFSENVNTPFYLDQGGNIIATVEVVDSADVTPFPSVTLLPENWTITNEVGSPKTFTSSAIPGSRIQNHLNAVHSFSARTTAFTGTMELRASLDLQPPSDITNYFPVDITSGSQIITFTNYTGITSHTFEANFMWIKFIYRPDVSLEDYGTVDKVLFR